MAAANVNKYRTTKDILIPAGTNVVFVSRMRQDVYRAAMAMVKAGPDMHYEWLMNFDEAIKLGFIELVTSERS